MYIAYFTVMISAFLVFLFVFYPYLSVSLSSSLPTPPSSSPPPPSVRTNCSQKPQHSKHSTQPKARSLSLSLALCRSLTHTHRNPHASHWVSLSYCYMQESACLSLFLSLCLRGEWDKVHWEQNNRTETQTQRFGGSSSSFRNNLNANASPITHPSHVSTCGEDDFCILVGFNHYSWWTNQPLIKAMATAYHHS